MSETRKEAEERYAREYEKYVESERAQHREPTNYMNWLAGRKIEEWNARSS